MTALPVPEPQVNPGYDPSCEECVEIGPAACWEHYTGPIRVASRAQSIRRRDLCRSSDCSMHAYGAHDDPTPEEREMNERWGSRTCPLP
jgi:hypothetical protein